MLEGVHSDSVFFREASFQKNAPHIQINKIETFVRANLVTNPQLCFDAITYGANLAFKFNHNEGDLQMELCLVHYLINKQKLEEANARIDTLLGRKNLYRYPTLLALTYMYKGAICTEKTSQRLALDYFLKALKIFNAGEDDLNASKALSNIGLVLQRQHQYDLAVDYFEQALERNPSPSDYFYASLYNNIGVVSGQLKNVGKAKENLTKALHYKEQYKGTPYYAATLANLGEVYIDQGDVELCLKSIREAFAIFSKYDDYRGIANVWLLEAKCCIFKKEFKLAKELAESALGTVVDLESLSLERDAYTVLSNIAYATENYKRAVEYLSYRSKINDKLESNITFYRIQDLELLEFETAKNTEIDLLLEMNEQLKLFAGKAAHDMKEPLRMISSYSNLLKKLAKDKLDKDENEFLAIIERSSKQMITLLDDLMLYSTAGGTNQSHLVDLKDVLLIVKDNLRLVIDETEAEIVISDMPVIYSDRTSLVRVFQNLIANSLKFRTESKPLIKVECREDENHFTFSVTDNGIGIPESQFKNIFQLTNRLHPHSRYQGSGIGLATCEKIIQSFGGEIWVKSEENSGSVFFFSIPKKG